MPVDTAFRRYTTAELRDMPATARFEDKHGLAWKSRGPLSSRYWDASGSFYVPLKSNCELARRLLRRIA